MSKIKNVFSVSVNENKNEKKTVKQKIGPSENKSPLAARPIPPSLLFIRSYPVSSSFLPYFGNALRIVITVNRLQPQLAPGHLACNSIQFTRCIAADIPLFCSAIRASLSPFFGVDAVYIIRK